jgi:hypothetical protein
MTLTQRRHQLLETWQRREEIYLRNMDALLFERDASQLESWLESREKLLAHEELGSSISEVEELIRRHEDFAKTLDAQDQKAEALKRITLVRNRTFLWNNCCTFQESPSVTLYFLVVGKGVPASAQTGRRDAQSRSSASRARPVRSGQAKGNAAHHKRECPNEFFHCLEACVFCFDCLFFLSLTWIDTRNGDKKSSRDVGLRRSN